MDDMLLGDFDPAVDKARDREFQKNLVDFKAIVKEVVNTHHKGRYVDGL